MTHTRTKLIVAGLAIASAVGFLAVAGVKEGWVYYLQVDQFVQSPNYHNQRVRLHGRVGEADFISSPADLRANFVLHGETASQAIEYHGVIPDLFKQDVDVVVEGQLDEAGVFQADTLMTKCASKYETEEGQAPHADPRSPEAS